MAFSITSQCNTLRSPQDGPIRITLFPVKSEYVPPQCTLPNDYNGEWINTANLDALVRINSTHMVESWRPDSGTEKEEVYVCQEHKKGRYLMARLGINGWSVSTPH